MDHRVRERLLRITSTSDAVTIAHHLAIDFGPAPVAATWLGDDSGVMADIFTMTLVPPSAAGSNAHVVARAGDRAARLGWPGSAAFFWCNIEREAALELWRTRQRRHSLARACGLEVRHEVLVTDAPTTSPLPQSRPVSGKWCTALGPEPAAPIAAAVRSTPPVRSTDRDL